MGGAVANSLAGQTQPAIEGELPSVTDQNQIQPREEPESKLRMDDPEIEHPPPSAESLLPEGLHLEARLDIRYAVESDVKSRTRAKDSKWYAVHGKYAGKQGAQRPLDHMLTDRRKYGRYAEGSVDDGWGGREARRGDGGGGRRRRSASPSRRPRRHRQTADDLDRELDAFQNGEPIQDPSLPMSGGMAADRMEHHHQGRRSRYGRDERGYSRKGRQGRARQEDLDAGESCEPPNSLPCNYQRVSRSCLSIGFCLNCAHTKLQITRVGCICSKPMIDWVRDVLYCTVMEWERSVLKSFIYAI